MTNSITKPKRQATSAAPPNIPNPQMRKINTMKSSIGNLMAIVCVCVIATISSSAQIFTFDEFGNSSGTGISPGIFQPDPSGGLAANVLVYNLPFSVIPGDVVLTEPIGLNVPPPSDIVRFWNPSGAGPSQIIFYSDFSSTDPADSPADTGLPAALMSLAIRLPEVGPEGNNGAVYTPTANQPGFILSTALPPATYNIISDVPEPGTIALVTVASALSWFRLKRRNTTPTN